MSWVLPTELSVGDTVASYDRSRCIEIDALESTHSDVCGPAIKIIGRAYLSMAAVVPDPVETLWPAGTPVYRMRQAARRDKGVG